MALCLKGCYPHSGQDNTMTPRRAPKKLAGIDAGMSYRYGDTFGQYNNLSRHRKRRPYKQLLHECRMELVQADTIYRQRYSLSMGQLKTLHSKQRKAL